MTLRVAFFGNSEGVFSNRHFAGLAKLSCDIVAVVDVPPARRTSTNTRGAGDYPSFLSWAQGAGVPALEPPSPNRPDFVAVMRDLAPDLLLAIGYTNLLKDDILAAPRLLPVNFHPSLLPAYRGKHPLFWALRHDERRAGLTVHVMDVGLDTGDILYQVRVRTRRDDSVSSLYDRVMERSLPLVGRLIADAEAGRLRPRPQGEAGVSCYSSVTEADFRLDWTRSAAQLRRWICTSPGQCCFDVAGQRVHIMAAELVSAAEPAAPGTLLSIARGTCTVATGDGALRLRRVRPDGESVQSMASWAAVVGLNPGCLLQNQEPS